MVWACALTWGFGAVVSLLLLVSAALVFRDPDAVLAEARRQNPQLEDQGVTEPVLLGVLAVVAWLVWRGHEWARIGLIVSASTTFGLAALGVFLNVAVLPVLIASGVVMRLLLHRQSVAWCRGRRPPG